MQIRHSKSRYYTCKFNEYKNNIKKTWNLINRTIKQNSKSNKKNIEKILYNNELLTDDKDIANSFNDFFSNIGNSIASGLPNSNQNGHLQFMTGNYVNSFFFASIDSNDVNFIISFLKNKSCNINTIPTKVLKYISPTICVILSCLINKSFECGIFPDILKVAHVVPIYKDDDKLDVSNYRPISILPVLSKEFEKAVFKQLYKYLTSNSILFNSQFGFQSGRSTIHSKLDQLKFIYNNVDSNKFVFTLFLDFRKAFDCVNYSILLK